MNLLFVDMHNKFRSKIAEAIFKKLAGEKIGVKSCGVILDIMRPFVCQNVHLALNELSYRIDNEQPRPLYRQDLDWADKIIIVSKGFPISIFDRVKEKVELWEIEGADEMEKEKIKKIADEIEGKVKDFINELD
jgi:protein-tyrosine-phosphatase